MFCSNAFRPSHVSTDATKDTEKPKPNGHMLEEGAEQVKVNATLAEKTGTTVHHRKTNPWSYKTCCVNANFT